MSRRCQFISHSVTFTFYVFMLHILCTSLGGFHSGPLISTLQGHCSLRVLCHNYRSHSTYVILRICHTAFTHLGVLSISPCLIVLSCIVGSSFILCKDDSLVYIFPFIYVNTSKCFCFYLGHYLGLFYIYINLEGV